MTVEKTAFSTGTHTARPSPVRTLSWRTNTHQAIVATTNQTRNPGVDVTDSSPRAHTSMPATKPAATRPATARLAVYASTTSRRTLLPASGTKRTSTFEKLSCEIPARNIIAEMSAALTPTTWAG